MRACIARRVRIAGLLAVFALLAAASPAYPSTDQAALFHVPEDTLLRKPAQTLRVLRSLGVRIVRLTVAWNAVAPLSNSWLRPPLFDASSPAAYPPANWAPYDAVVHDAPNYGMQVELVISGDAPLWATSSGAPQGLRSVWNPSPTQYGQFVQAVATRYPTVHMWELWNEPNWLYSLAPQVDPKLSAIVSARDYRSLVNDGWLGLKRAGHGGDTIIVGGLSPDGSGSLLHNSVSAPLAFIRTLYCLDGSYHELRGAAAQAVGCPTTASPGQFAGDYPALFKLTGFGVHPYSGSAPPIVQYWGDPNALEFAGIPHLIGLLDRVRGLYGSGVPGGIYNTEFGYLTTPPLAPGWATATPPTAAAYMNWAEYLSWKNPRILTYAQYELRDQGWFTTGLLFSDGQPKPSFYAYLLPLFLPTTVTRKGHSLELWGGVRPAANATLDTGHPQTALIQFQRWPRGPFRTINRVQIANPSGYFDLRIKFPASGAVRLAWSYPAGDQQLQNPLDPGRLWIYSRVVSVTLHPARNGRRVRFGRH